MPLVTLFYSTLHRHLFCRRGVHDRKLNPDGSAPNFCGHCGYTLNPNAFRQWIVTLRTGETREVSAINVHHARSLVIHGDKPTYDKVGMVVKCHPDNIISTVQTWTPTHPDQKS